MHPVHRIDTTVAVTTVPWSCPPWQPMHNTGMPLPPGSPHPLPTPQPWWCNMFFGQFGAQMKEVQSSLYSGNNPASLDFMERVGFLQDEEARIRRTVEQAMKRLGIADRDRLRDVVDYPRRPLLCRTAPRCCAISRAAALRALRQETGMRTAAMKVRVIHRSARRKKSTEAQVIHGSARSPQPVLPVWFSKAKKARTNRTRYEAFIIEGLTDLERATDHAVLRTALVLGLCAETLYDPSPNRPIVWTAAALRRHVELYTVGRYYHADH